MAKKEPRKSYRTGKIPVSMEQKANVAGDRLGGLGKVTHAENPITKITRKGGRDIYNARTSALASRSVTRGPTNLGGIVNDQTIRRTMRAPVDAANVAPRRRARPTKAYSFSHLPPKASVPTVVTPSSPVSAPSTAPVSNAAAAASPSPQGFASKAKHFLWSGGTKRKIATLGLAGAAIGGGAYMVGNRN
jgi:hypothetical protein